MWASRPVAKLAEQVEDHLSRLRSRQQRLLDLADAVHRPVKGVDEQAGVQPAWVLLRVRASPASRRRLARATLEKRDFRLQRSDDPIADPDIAPAPERLAWIEHLAALDY